MLGWVDVYADDHELIAAAVPTYEALYQWCRRQRAPAPARG